MSRTRTFSPSENPQLDRRFVMALARGLQVLQCFTPRDRWLPHRELVLRTGLPEATVSRMAFTLVQLGYLRHRSAAGEYALSAAVLALGFSMLSNFDIGRAARPIMQDLANRAQAAVSLGTRHDLSMIYVAHCRSAARLTLGLDVGTRLPIATTAMGRAVFCSAPDVDRERLSRQLQAVDPQRWPTVSAGLAASAALYLKRGFVDSISDWDNEIAAIGVPVEIGAGKGVFALTIGGPADRLRGPFLYDELGPALVSAADRITKAVRNASWQE